MTPAHSVTPAEPLARFVLTRSHINWEDSARPRLRPEAFMPHPRNELSVFRIEGLDQNNVREIGEDVATRRGKTLIGRGEVTAGNIQSIGLRVEPKEPPPRHADILGWPALSGTPKGGQKPAETHRAADRRASQADSLMTSRYTIPIFPQVLALLKRLRDRGQIQHNASVLPAP